MAESCAVLCWQAVAQSNPDSGIGTDSIKALLGATGPLTPANAGGVNIDPPSTADEYASEEESEARPRARDLSAPPLRSSTRAALSPEFPVTGVL